MKLIQPSVEIIPQEPGLEGIYKQIELGGRCCYNSYDKICEGSAKKFIDTVLIPREHFSPCAHGTVYLTITCTTNNYYNIIEKYRNNFWSKVIEIVDKDDRNAQGLPYSWYYITTNYRVIIENHWENDLDYLCEPTKFHAKRVTTRWFTNIGVSREANRHATILSICEQSTRYCNYSKDKFDNQIKISEPLFLDKCTKSYDSTTIIQSYLKDFKYDDATPIDYWIAACEFAEYCYMGMINSGATPQEARSVLPLSTQTEVYYTAFIDDWKHFFNLRCSEAAHPDIKFLAKSLEQQFKEINLI